MLQVCAFSQGCGAECGTQHIVFRRELSPWLVSGADTFESAQSLGERYLTKPGRNQYACRPWDPILPESRLHYA